MEILICNYKDPTHNEAGGSERYVLELAKEWTRTGHIVTFYTSKHRGSWRHELRDGVVFIRSGSKFTVFRNCKYYLKRNPTRFDLVVDSVNQRSFRIHRITRGKSLSIVHHMGGAIWKAELSPLLGWIGLHILEPIFYRELRGANIIADSNDTRRDLERRGLKVISVVHPGCDTPKVTGDIVVRPWDDSPQITFIGRMVNNKRPMLAVEAFQVIRRQFPQAQLHLIGDGYLRSHLESLDLPGVFVHGYLDDHQKTKLLERSRLLLVTSIREGWGIVVIEAGTYGVPVIGTKVEGLTNSVIEGVTGFLVDATAEDLGAASIRLLENPQLWETMSSSSRIHSSGYTWELSSKDILDIVDKIDSA